MTRLQIGVSYRTQRGHEQLLFDDTFAPKAVPSTVKTNSVQDGQTDHGSTVRLKSNLTKNLNGFNV